MDAVEEALGHVGVSDADEQLHQRDDDATEINRAAAMSASPAEEYPYLFTIRRQHRRNLAAIMRRAMLTADYCTATGAVGALLGCERETLHYMHNAPPHQEDDFSPIYMMEAVWCAIEVLKQHQVAPEQVKRVIRKTAALLLLYEGMRQACQLELIMAYWNRSRPDEFRQGLSVLQHELSRQGFNSTPAFLYHLSTLAAYMKHRTWMEQLLGLSHKTQQQQAQASLAAWQQQRRQEQLGPLQLALQPRRELAAGSQDANSSSSSSRQDADDVIKHLQQALEVFPAASLPNLLLCHTLVVTDRTSEAVDAAAAAVQASGRAVGALSLLAVLTQPAGAAAGGPLTPAALMSAAAAPGSQRSLLSGSTAAAAADGEGSDSDDDTDAVHEYVGLCLEIVQADPWSTGAVQGLMQQSGHCSSCGAQAVRGLLVHLDEAANQAAGDAAEHGYVGSDTLSTAAAAAAGAGNSCVLAQLWPVLATLLVQLADAAAAVRVTAATASETHSPAAAGSAAATTNGNGHPQHSNSRHARGNTTPAATAAAESSSEQHGSGDLQLWLQLQQGVFAQRQRWWPTSPLASIEELQLLWKLAEQLEEQLLQHSQQQQQQDADQQQMQEPELQQGSNLQEQQLSQEPTQGLQQQEQQQHHDTATRAQPVVNGLTTVAARQPEDETVAAPAVGFVMHGVWSDQHQLLIDKAVVMAFVLGPGNAYTQDAVLALEAVAEAAAAAAGGASVEQQRGPAATYSGVSNNLHKSASAARVTLADAMALAQLLKVCQQEQERQLQQQHVPVAPKRLLGAPSPQYGAMLDMPHNWWATFPFKRRREHQQ